MNGVSDMDRLLAVLEQIAEMLRWIAETLENK